ncbi:TRAP transporter substrate-binding protein DctP [Bradyrhizobium sp. AZCC 1693]|uniref:TRAP transporter substrate-binding protein DctP n=1 Tax=Bradyrhizobium sp. AZCC 1693 TaxID=3117029 RepID=UPI002FF0FC36
MGLRISVAILLSLTCSQGWAQSNAIRVVSSFSEKSSLASTVREFQTRTTERLGKEWKIEILPPSVNVLDTVRTGGADLAVLSTSALASRKSLLSIDDNDTSFAIFDLPFFFKDLQEAQEVQKSAVGDTVLASVGKLGLVGLGYWNGGMSQLFGKPVQSVDRLKGLKFRTTISPEGRAAVAALGASPSTFAAGEIGMALQAGAIDAIETAPHYVTDGVINLQGGSISEINFRPLVAVVVARREFWRTLSLQNQTILLDEVSRSAESATNQAIQRDRSALDQLNVSAVYSHTDISPMELANFRQSASKTWGTTTSSRVDGVLFVSKQIVARTPPTTPSIAPSTMTVSTPVFFATDRKDEGATDPNVRFAGQRGTLSFGRAEVTVGINRPVASDPDPATKLDQISLLSRADFIAKLNDRLTGSSRKEVLIYVHGFKNSFADAAKNAALLASDIKLDGAVTIFSWPSAAIASEYWGDEDEVLASRAAFLDFLQAVRSAAGAGRINIVAHSMGSRLIAEAMEWALGRPGFKQPLLQHLVLAAPDIYVARFEQAAPSLVAFAKRVTLYASDNDQALWCSNQIVHSKRRAGQGGKEVVVVSGVDTLDATPADVRPWWQWRPCGSGHSYLTRNSSVLADLHNLMTFDAAPRERFRLQARQKGTLSYWIFQAAQ